MSNLRRVYDRITGRFRSERQTWLNPRDSIGDEWDVVKDKRGIVQMTCWDAKGPAGMLWETLGIEIRDYMADYRMMPGVHLSEDLMCEFMMFGPTEDTATPTVIFRSGHTASRRRAVRAVCKSRILHNYPGVEVTALTPRKAPGSIEPLAEQEDDDPLGEFYSDNPHMVFAVPLGPPVGRRLFVTDVLYGDLPQNATGGPLLRVGGRYFQLTAGHVFQQMAPPPPTTSFDGPRMEDLELDYLGKPEDEDQGNDESMEQLTIPLLGVHSSSQQPLPTPAGTGTARSVSAIEPQFRNRRSVKIGRPLQLPEDTELDYALIELDPPHHDDFNNGLNRIRFNHDSEDSWLNIARYADVRSKPKHMIKAKAWVKAMASFDIPTPYILVAVLTTSSGLLMGKLCSTPSYLPLFNDLRLHEVFPVRLKGGKIAKGDSGSPVVDRINGSFLGHIVAGAVGSDVAYMVSATAIITDIEQRLGHSVEFNPKSEGPSDLESPKLPWKSSLNPNRKARAQQWHGLFQIRYDLGAPSQSIEFGSKLSLRRAQALGTPDSTLLARNAKQTRGAQGHHSPGANQTTGELDRQSNFEALFGSLPLELQQEIFGYLEVPDILNLRLISKPWHNLVASKELEIAFSYLRQPHIPALAIQLFPPTSPTTDLLYISALWRRYSTACGLATLISDWLTTDMFLQKTPDQRAEFGESESLIRRRLVPLVIAMMHFFETYSALRLDPLTADVDHTILERQIMSDYDDETLLQVHQLFRILMAFQTRNLRPPSYMSRTERSLRGYRRSDPPPENVQIAMLYIGGLQQLFRLAKIQPYEKRRQAVDVWFEGVTRDVPCEGEGSTKPTEEPASGLKDKGKAVLFPTSLGSRPAGGSPSVQGTQEILRKLPVSKSQIWVSTAESLLIERGKIEKVQDIKGDAGVLQELILRDVKWADIAFFRRGMNGELDTDAEVVGLAL